MGWLRYLFLGDIGQQLDLSEQRDEIADLRASLTNSRAKERTLDRLAAENDHLKLTLYALIRLLEQRRLISDAELDVMIDRIDAEDGRSDGRNCPS